MASNKEITRVQEDGKRAKRSVYHQKKEKNMKLQNQ